MSAFEGKADIALASQNVWLLYLREGRIHMRAIVIVIGVILIVVGVVYFLVPADALPTFFPGHETGLMRIRVKHGMLSGALGIVLLALSWWMGRK